MSDRVRLPFLAALATLCLTSCSTATPQAATPHRPTYSTDTSTTAPGTLELEAGLVADDEGNGDVPLLLKYGIAPSLELLGGFSPLKRIDDGSTTETGVGDVTLGAKYRFPWPANEFTFAAQGLAKVPTADEDKGIGSGETDVYISAIATRPWSHGSWTAYYQADVLGRARGGNETAHSLALAAGWTVRPGISLIGELVATQRSGPDPVVATAAVAWASSPDLVIDAALTAGLNNAATDAVFTVGVTKNFGN